MVQANDMKVYLFYAEDLDADLSGNQSMTPTVLGVATSVAGLARFAEKDRGIAPSDFPPRPEKRFERGTYHFWYEEKELLE